MTVLSGFFVKLTTLDGQWVKIIVSTTVLAIVIIGITFFGDAPKTEPDKTPVSENHNDTIIFSGNHFDNFYFQNDLVSESPVLPAATPEPTDSPAVSDANVSNGDTSYQINIDSFDVSGTMNIGDTTIINNK